MARRGSLWYIYGFLLKLRCITLKFVDLRGFSECILGKNLAVIYKNCTILINLMLVQRRLLLINQLKWNV